MEINNKLIAITGASSGLGRETTILLSRLGAHVVLVARSEELLKAVQAAIKELTKESPLAVQYDSSSEEDVADMAARRKKKYGVRNVA